MEGSTAADSHRSYFFLRAPTADQHQRQDPEPAGPLLSPWSHTEPGSTAEATRDFEPDKVTVRANASTHSRVQEEVLEARQPCEHILSTEGCPGIDSSSG